MELQRRMDGLALAERVARMGVHTKIILITGFQEFDLPCEMWK